MTAPIVDEFACTAHPEGSVQECGPCATVRRRQKAWMQRYDTPMKGAAHISPRGRDGRVSNVRAAENVYEQALRVHKLRTRNARPLLTDELTPEEQAYESARRAFWGARAADGHRTRRNDDDSVARGVGDVGLTVSHEGDEEAAHSVRVVGVDGTHAFMQVIDPEVVRVGRVEVENGSVVVQLDSHGRKRIARRILAAGALAAIALWAVAS